MPASTCWYVSVVNAERTCPSAWATILVLMPDRKSAVANHALIVQSHVPEFDAFGYLGERVRQRVRVDRAAVTAFHDEVGVLPRRAAQQPALGLRPVMASERRRFSSQSISSSPKERLRNGAMGSGGRR